MKKLQESNSIGYFVVGKGSDLPSSYLPHFHGLVSRGRHYMVTIRHDGYR